MNDKDTKTDVKDELVLESQVSEPLPLHLQLDVGQERGRYRKRWWQIWRPRDPPPPARNSLADAPIIPIVNASIFSILTYSWITELMVLGYQRTLQAPDLWKMDDSRSAGVLSTKLEESWDRRVKEAENWNAQLASGQIKPGLLRRVGWSIQAARGGKGYNNRRSSLEYTWRKTGGRKHASLAWALNDTFGVHFWAGGLFKVAGDTAQLMGPLVIKTIINFSKKRAAAKAIGATPPPVGHGVGMAIGTFLIVITASVCQHQFFWRSMTTGVLARAALINTIYKRGVNLTGKSRTRFPNSALVNHVSTDVSRIDACAQWFHAAWTAPIQVIVCLIILLVQLGPSALAGFALFLLIFPLQLKVMGHQFHVRKKMMVWTDKRAKLLLEVLGAMRVVKYFSYEIPFLKLNIRSEGIFDIRKNELRGVRNIQLSFSANIALAFSLPVLAATLAFVTYTLTAHEFDIAVIFASTSLFQLLRQPMMFLPRALSATSDARNALARLTPFFHAELRPDNTLSIDPAQKFALHVQDATFEWEEVPQDSTSKSKEKEKEKSVSDPFQVRHVNMTIPRGQLIAVVGPVGSGKSSLLQGLIGEMRNVTGHVSFGGSVAYCPQTAWIQNATLRENITFGHDFDEDRYWRAVRDASLVPDLLVLPDGDLTEIGEKGVNISGGQRQRVNIARALYYDTDIVILDDPLSAVDAHVGKSLFQDAILGSLRGRGKTVILVTHALHFLSQCDYIYTLVNGRIAEHGTFAQLISNKGEFARLDKEFGGSNEKEEKAEHIEESPKPPQTGLIDEAKLRERKGAGIGRLEGRLIVKERRTTGSVSWRIYWSYLVAGRGYLTGPLVVFCVLMMQGSTVLNSYTLIWWQANTFHRPDSFYQILYACLGISQAVFTFLMGAAMDVMSFYVSQNLHHGALRNIFYAPMSFFDTTPIGRIISVFGKDIDTIDNQLAISMRLFILVMAGVVGSVLVITILENYFIIAVVAMGFGYSYFAAFYRSSAREMKRLDSMLRSVLYSHFSESLTGLPTIRSFGEIPRFIRDNNFYVDLQDRALYLTVTNQRWLAIRLDFCGATLVFVVCIFAVVGVSGTTPAQIGLVLTYASALSQMLGVVTRQSAEVENYMNSVERVVHYSQGDFIEQEAPHEIDNCKPPPQWPMHGSIEFKDISMRYRPGLPKVLDGISMTVKGGERIGVVGRTGAGKSSLMLALFRIVELSTGSITIDGIDISKIGLKDLRSQISIIPQDPLLFSGTVRSNLDPFSLYEDARLWDSLRRSFLVETDVEELVKGDSDFVTSTLSDFGQRTSASRVNLDLVLESEGANLSVGQRCLLSLARALVKDSRVVVLDEATASVDLETDSKIQHTIHTEFHDRTLLCIAHRLRTILSYDRILVLDAGKIAEFDTPRNLFARTEGIFRGMCDRSGISLDDIRLASKMEESL